MLPPNPVLICPQCDALYRRPVVDTGHTAHCIRCDYALIHAASASALRVLYLSIAALVSFILALTSPALSVTIQGVRTDMTLWRMASGAARGAWSIVVYPIATALLVAPALQAGILGWVMAFAWRGVRAPGVSRIMRAWRALRVCTGADVVATALTLTCLQMRTIAGADMQLGEAVSFLAAGCVLAFVAGCHDPQTLAYPSALHRMSQIA